MILAKFSPRIVQLAPQLDGSPTPGHRNYTAKQLTSNVNYYTDTHTQNTFMNKAMDDGYSYWDQSE